jgi:uncharacterized tellurite resistance protein B-like protein
MIAAIKEFFEQHISNDDSNTGESLTHRLQLATAALFVEMTRMDHEIPAQERVNVQQLLEKKFAIDSIASGQLLALAEDEARDAIDYYQFTSLIHEHFDYEKKCRIIEHLWEIAYSDAQLHKYEEHFVRRIADLLYIRHQDFIAAKQRVLKGLQG